MEEEKGSDLKFYKGLLAAFVVGIILITGLLIYLWLFLKDYEECLAENAVKEVAESCRGADIYYYEDTVRGSGQKRFYIQDGDTRLATVILEPSGKPTAFDHQRYRVSYIEKEKRPEDDIMQIVAQTETQMPEESVPEGNESVSGNTVSGDETDGEEEPSLPVTDEEKDAVKNLAESYVKVYAPFSTIKEIGDLRTRVLALIKKDTNLYDRLKSYQNGWGQAVNGYDFGETEVTDIKKTADNGYSCDVASEFITNSANYGVNRTYDLTYHMEMEYVDGTLLITIVE